MSSDNIYCMLETICFLLCFYHSTYDCGMIGKMTTVNNKGGQILEGNLNIVPSSSKGIKLLFANLYNMYYLPTKKLMTINFVQFFKMGQNWKYLQIWDFKPLLPLTWGICLSKSPLKIRIQNKPFKWKLQFRLEWPFINLMLIHKAKLCQEATSFIIIFTYLM